MRLFILQFVLIACGSAQHAAAPAPVVTATPTAAASVVPTSLAVADASKLPACDAAHDQQLVYTLADRKFQTCQAGAWQAIDTTPAVKVSDIVSVLALAVLCKTIPQQDPRVQALLATDYTAEAPIGADIGYSNKGAAYNDGTSSLIFGLRFTGGLLTVINYQADTKPAVHTNATCP